MRLVCSADFALSYLPVISEAHGECRATLQFGYCSALHSPGCPWKATHTSHMHGVVQAYDDPDYASGSAAFFLGFVQVSCSRRVLKHMQCDPCRQVLRSRSAVKSADFQQ